ncbi:hypothetical protein HMN09_00891400 [Mycena chlorophos]|uniref:Uncharacterized protein n=1 Tax=Mycena chlorophos TaxID=658473 RepID=A0A8H6SNJ0_MYCCL|nr:hypothetical protein HMN09_00891400 [Mycena chlorophos]
MSTKRRVGVSAATTEAARRALMQPVQCWEKVWVVPDVLAGNASASTMRVSKWVKTNKTQQFSDDEGNVDEPLAPLPDEAEVVDGEDEEGDEKDDKDENQPESVAPSRPPELEDRELPSKPPSPKPQLTMSTEPLPTDSALDPALNTMESSLDPSLNTIGSTMDTLGDGLDAGVGVDLGADVGLGADVDGSGLMDISGLGADGLGLEGAHDLSQLDPGDALLGGPLQMDESEDPFAGAT